MADPAQAATKRPNFLFILADDLGFSDIGCYGAEIQTPNLDGLAGEGLRMLNHHTAAACSPTRAMLMSGTDAHLGGLGVLIEYKRSAAHQQRFSGKAGYEGYLNEDVATLPEILGDHGYFTAMAGKVRLLASHLHIRKAHPLRTYFVQWHLGLRASQGPWQRGFQKTFAMLPGCCNHYGWEPVQEKFPTGGRPIHADKNGKVDVPPNKTEDPSGFYSTDTYTRQLIEFLDERTDEEREKPFFSFLPYTAPHWPLQCSKAARDKYKGMYDDGPYALRERRLKRLVELGIIQDSVVPHEVETSRLGYSEWDDFTPEEKKLSSRAMEAYAGMVDTVDANVGKVVEYLRKTGEYDNTFIVFMSDNGAEGAAMEAVPVMGDNIREAIHKYYDNSYENIGAWNSFTWLGPLWAQASTAPSRLFKCFPSEGGILVPCIVKPPAGTLHPSLAPGSLNRAFGTVMDFLPTFLELAGIPWPCTPPRTQPTDLRGFPADRTPAPRRTTRFRGRDVHVARGASWAAYLTRGHHQQQHRGEEENENNDDETWAVHAATEAVGWELFARAALRQGDWKIVHLERGAGGAGHGDAGWELFNLRADPGETTDLAAAEPRRLRALLARWDEYVVACGVVWGPEALRGGLAPGEAPDLWEDEAALQRAWIGAGAGEVPEECR
ncbi:alkaline-phosphatase-like protein [Xylariomycetidae sp. FL0641]|nr:alkaline-phosphatase-like protein [Xylariomycetidae sp. FL0641]